MANWSLLPANPLAFFELSPNFDRKDLKRAYGKLIKQYKPETHPAEFQRIREAYEMLESQNRYGVAEAQMKQAANAWAVAVQTESSTSDTQSRKAGSSSSQATLDLTVPVSSPQESYKQLKSQSPKTPQTYFALATLSDLVEPQSANMYLKWLLTGIKEFPSDPGLLRLLSEYLSAFTETPSAGSVLLTIAKLVAGDDFYRVTEALWDRLLSEQEFSLFSRALDACEKQLKHRTFRPRLAFYIHILRLAMFKAPATWIEERLKFIETHGSELGSGMDEEIELLRALHKYRHQDREMLTGTPVGAKVDRLVAAFCKGSSAAAASEVTLILDELARNGNGWQQAFPAAETEKYQDCLWLCMMIAADVAQQTGVDFGRVNHERMQQQADATVSDIVKTIEEIASRINWLRLRIYGMPFLIFWLGPLILTFGMSYWGLIFVVWTALAILSFAGVAIPLYLKKRADDRIEKLIQQEYENLWRPRMFRYVQACHAPAQVSITELQKSARDLGQTGIVDVVLSFAFADRAMHLFNLLQLFVH